MERSQALALLQKYNQEPFHIMHALTVEGVMRWYAQELGYGDDVDFWGLVGLLHDVDFENIHQHCKRHWNYWLKSTQTMPLSMPSSAMAMASVSMSHRST